MTTLQSHIYENLSLPPCYQYSDYLQTAELVQLSQSNKKRILKNMLISIDRSHCPRLLHVTQERAQPLQRSHQSLA